MDLRASLMVVAHPAQVTDLVEEFEDLNRELAAGCNLVANSAARAAPWRSATLPACLRARLPPSSQKK